MNCTHRVNDSLNCDQSAGHEGQHSAFSHRTLINGEDWDVRVFFISEEDRAKDRVGATP